MSPKIMGESDPDYLGEESFFSLTLGGLSRMGKETVIMEGGSGR